MSQFDFGTIDPNVMTGTQLAIALNQWRDAVNSGHRGASRPEYVRPGMLWVLEVDEERWDLILFDGDSDIPLMSINPDTHEIIGGGAANPETLEALVQTWPVGVPQHLAAGVNITDLPDCAVLDGTAMPEWASPAVQLLYGATLPDYRGRVPVGVDAGSGRVAANWAQTAGLAGGEERHTITNGEMPSHGHSASTANAGIHGHSGSANNAGNHGHSGNIRTNLSANAANGTGFHSSNVLSTNGSSTTNSNVVANDGVHSHGVSIDSGGVHSHGVTVSNNGGGDAMNIMQPGLAGVWVMRLR